ncbi:hypothetical protein CCACVL1_03813 [Corchorus capsularis]|uniref:Uncharacterized protein n=1 Tax=Corchorus capsularis TaxID=210143 RepID=A0A1R3JX60_COCAP|nr:hypothetical protein CCACVL1_03813 [Corchorus capsularis]
MDPSSSKGPENHDQKQLPANPPPGYAFHQVSLQQNLEPTGGWVNVAPQIVGSATTIALGPYPVSMAAALAALSLLLPVH